MTPVAVASVAPVCLYCSPCNTCHPNLCHKYVQSLLYQCACNSSYCSNYRCPRDGSNYCCGSGCNSFTATMSSATASVAVPAVPTVSPAVAVGAELMLTVAITHVTVLGFIEVFALIFQFFLVLFCVSCCMSLFHFYISVWFSFFLSSGLNTGLQPNQYDGFFFLIA